MRYWEAYNSIYTKIIENNIDKNVIKLIILLIILGIGLKLVKNCLEFIFNTIKKILGHIKKAHAGINDDIQEKYLEAPVFTKNDILWLMPNFLKETVQHKQVSLIKAGIFLIIRPRYIQKIFSNAFISEQCIEQKVTKDLIINVNKVILNPRKLSYVELRIKNIGTNDVELLMPISKKNEWFKMYISMYNGEKHLIRCKEIDDGFGKNVRIASGESISVSLYFETIEVKSLHKLNKVSIEGFVRIQGSKEHIPYALEINKSIEKEDDFREFLVSGFDNVELFNIVKRGGLVFLHGVIMIVLFGISIIINNTILKIVIWIASTVIYMMAVHLNIILIQYIYDLIYGKSKNDTHTQ